MPANVNGTQVQLLIDTGSGLSSISQKAVDVLKLKPQATDWQSYDLYGNMSQQFVSLDTLQVGPLKAKNLHLMIWPNPGLSSDGLIGGDILSHYDVELNFVARKLNLFSPDHCEGKVIYWPATAGAIVPFSMRRPSAGDTDIHVPITVDGKDLQAIIDTGRQ